MFCLSDTIWIRQLPPRPYDRSSRAMRTSWSTVWKAAVKSSRHNAETRPLSAACSKCLNEIVSPICTQMTRVYLEWGLSPEWRRGWWCNRRWALMNWVYGWQMVKEKVEALASAKYYCFRFVAFKWHQFQWLRVTSIPDFKVTILSRNMQVSHAAMYSTFDRSYTRILHMYEYTNSTHGDNSFFWWPTCFWRNLQAISAFYRICIHHSCDIFTVFAWNGIIYGRETSSFDFSRNINTWRARYNFTDSNWFSRVDCWR